MPHQSVHPRGCGEYGRLVFIRLPAFGSSPRMRGIQMGGPVYPGLRRFIPADAGNTRRPVSPARPAAVHPRGCGEYLWPQALPLPVRGSSPRMRGIRQCGVIQQPVVRFIPADAGNTTRKTAPDSQQPVHPRGCGEYQNRQRRGGHARGSSPRMRGILHLRGLSVPAPRFIPADAGNTQIR